MNRIQVVLYENRIYLKNMTWQIKESKGLKESNVVDINSLLKELKTLLRRDKKYKLYLSCYIDVYALMDTANLLKSIHYILEEELEADAIEYHKLSLPSEVIVQNGEYWLQNNISIHKSLLEPYLKKTRQKKVIFLTDNPPIIKGVKVVTLPPSTELFTRLIENLRTI